MNVLPLVSTFILLFAVASYTFVHNMRATVQEQFHYHSAQAIEEKFANSIQSKVYTAQKGKNLHKKPTSPSGIDKNTRFTSPRDKFRLYPERTLNIRTLANEGGDPQVEEIALSLIRNLYQTTLLYTPHLENEILETIIQTLKEYPSLTNFESLLSRLPEEKLPLFYKLTKGTHSYQLKTDKGYPALGDFLSIHPSSHKKPIYFSHAPRPLLDAVFGQLFASQIILEERRKWELEHKHDPLNQQELEAFFLKNRKNLTEFVPLLNFKKSKSKSKETVETDDAKLRIRIN